MASKGSSTRKSRKKAIATTSNGNREAISRSKAGGAQRGGPDLDKAIEQLPPDARQIQSAANATPHIEMREENAMKTISIPRSRGAAWTLAAVLSSLTALYFFRRRGGRVSSLFKPALNRVSQARSYLRRSSQRTPKEQLEYSGLEGALPTA